MVEIVGDEWTAARQFCNRWVFLKHQRSAAFRELQELIACHIEMLSTDERSIVNGIDGIDARCAVAPVADVSPIRDTAASSATESGNRE